MRHKSRKETSSSKKSANGPDKISVYDSDVKGPSKYIGPIKVITPNVLAVYRSTAINVMPTPVLEHPQRVSSEGVAREKGIRL
ncbi:hypothetical protein TNCV_1936241 [Trichonephila clavipes]|nr:hypothetical protein TNCV_1936241 [Trichonephila clavipes]